MKNKIFYFFIFFLIIPPTFAQVKIGNNPASIHSSSILELESSDKVLVISKMTTTQMNATQPLRGALVFNTEENCVFIYDGTSWRNLCDLGAGINVTTSTTAPTNNKMGDFWINKSYDSSAYIWDGTSWDSMDNNPRRGNGIPNNTTAPNPIAGDVYVDNNSGMIYAYDGSTWITSNSPLSANNGLLINSSNTIQLGGVLIQPTIIETNNINTITINGLQNGNTTTDDIVTINKTTGVLKKTSASNILRENVIKIIANDGQVTFTGLTLYTTDKINVYRNGVRIDFTLINSTTIEIEPSAICYAGDEIRIVQLY
ncbi:hypothetical protein [Tenacibaculum sp.]|uniref:hypothetical protein n=1 Tax=Tenacibaculum sp. TaxID=1906242 RepID=UPI003D10EFF3